MDESLLQTPLSRIDYVALINAFFSPFFQLSFTKTVVLAHDVLTKQTGVLHPDPFGKTYYVNYACTKKAA